MSFDANGTLSVPSGSGNEFIEPELNRRAHAAGVKVLLLLGGDFNGLETTGEVQTLVDNIAAFEKQYGYDGADIDREYPATAGDPNVPGGTHAEAAQVESRLCAVRSTRLRGAVMYMTRSTCSYLSTTSIL